MSTKVSLNIKLPVSWYRRIRSLAYSIGLSAHDLIRFSIIKGLCTIYLYNLDVQTLLDNVYERYEPKVSIHPRVPRWLKKALESFAEDLGLSISAFARACIVAALGMVDGKPKLELRLSESERRFIENLKETFGRG